MATSAASPSQPSEVVGQVLRGNNARGRNKMTVDSVQRTADGTEDMAAFFNTAKTPKATPEKKKRKPLKQDNRKVDVSKGVKKRQPRFSVGSNEEGSTVGTEKATAFRKKLGAFSPGDLSTVTTAPPSPKESPEKARGKKTQDDEEEEVVKSARANARTTPTKTASPLVTMSPANDDFPVDDDEEDLLPPPPPDTLMEEDPVSMSVDDVDFPVADDSPGAPSVASSTKRKAASPEPPMDDDDDNDGPGFAMNSPPAQSVSSGTATEPSPVKDVPPKKKRGRKSAAKKSSEKKAPVNKTPAKKTPARKKKKTGNTAPMFSPPGYPVGHREMKPVPISDMKGSPDPDPNVRRSRRSKVPPLAYWKNERVIFGPHDEEGELGEEMGAMSVPHSILQALDTPRRQRKVTFSSVRPAAAKAAEEEKPFNSSRLRKKYKFLNGDSANVWDESMEDSDEQKVVSYADQLTVTSLPLPPSRKKSEGKVVGHAAQSFNIESGENDVTVGYIMGNLLLPPKGIKDPESTGACSQVFTVCRGQPKSLEIAYGDPHEEEGSLNPDTCQRFLLSAGDQFRIPPGNAYRLLNHSTTTEAFLAWTIVRPRVVA